MNIAVLTQELKSLREQAKRAGKKGKEEFNKREEEMIACHQREIGALADHIRMHEIGPKTPTLSQSALNKVCLSCQS